jgi:hypothetical protein
MTNGHKQRGASDQPTERSRSASTPTGPAARIAPGDEAPPGELGTGENICPRCGGSGFEGTRACTECGGRGLVTVIIGGA